LLESELGSSDLFSSTSVGRRTGLAAPRVVAASIAPLQRTARANRQQFTVERVD
jgi:hypothetical protein